MLCTDEIPDSQADNSVDSLRKVEFKTITGGPAP